MSRNTLFSLSRARGRSLNPACTRSDIIRKDDRATRGRRGQQKGKRLATTRRHDDEPPSIEVRTRRRPRGAASSEVTTTLITRQRAPTHVAAREEHQSAAMAISRVLRFFGSVHAATMDPRGAHRQQQRRSPHHVSRASVPPISSRVPVAEPRSRSESHTRLANGETLEKRIT